VTATPTKPTRRRETTRELLLDAALAVFARDGIAATTVEHMCAQAGFTRGAFYSNFATKEELLAALRAREEAATLAHIEAALAGLAPGTHDPIATLVDVVLASLPDSTAMLAIQIELELMALRGHAVDTAMIQSMHQELAEVIERAVALAGRRLCVPVADALAVILAVFEQSCRAAVMTGAAPDDLVRRLLPRIVTTALTEPAE
jgi:AcrR family transcriptional regulator